MSFEVGDRVLAIAPCDGLDLVGKVGSVVSVRESSYDTTIGVDFDEKFTKGHTLGGQSKNNNGRWCEIYSLKKINSPSMATLKDKFSLIFKGEPDKSFIKAGVMNADESLTTDGQALLLSWLLKKNGDAFKTEVVDQILAEDEKE